MPFGLRLSRFLPKNRQKVSLERLREAFSQVISDENIGRTDNILLNNESTAFIRYGYHIRMLKTGLWRSKIEICDFRLCSETYHSEIWGQGKTNPSLMTQSEHPAFIWYMFHCCGCIVSESISAQNCKKHDGRTDGRTDRQVQDCIPPFNYQPAELIFLHTFCD